ncbi:MAG: glycerophosphoryl diester phosphodiesterase membrane domain-containing protein [Blautia sp.]|nr:glycerophosphoryl diester phosphodiesterase membrane domain-containing protein [Blautia sp.]
MSEFRSISRSLTMNIRTLLHFEGIFKLLTVVLAVPIYTGFFRLTMWLSGYHYLTAENLLRFMIHPAFIICFSLVLVLAVLYTMLDMGAVIYNLHKSFVGERTDVFHTFLYTVREMGTALRTRKKRLVLASVFLILPIFGIGFLPAVTGNLLVRDFLIKRIGRHWYFLVLFILLYFLDVVFFFHQMYTYQIMILEDSDFHEALRRSIRLGKGRRIWDAVIYMGVLLLCYAAYAVLIGLAMLIAMALEHILRPTSLVNPISTSLMLSITTVGMILFASWTAPMSCGCISSLYYFHKKEKQAEIPGRACVECRANIPFLRRHMTLVKFMELLFFGVSLAICGIYLFQVYTVRMNPRIEYLHQLEVTAHRGASKFYPENTMSAFVGALELGADWIELDIHLSKDGRIYVMHDASLHRTCGVRERGWNLSWEELAKLDAGRWFSREFKGEPIPLLADVIDFAKENKIRLNIELKPSKQEKGLEETLVNLLVEKEFIPECVVTSQSYHSINKVKRLREDIKTVYVMGYAYGNLPKLASADAFSINMSSVSRTLVRRVHNAGKEIYVWTVNKRYNIEDMIAMNVDNIITDDVSLAKKIVGETRTSNALHEYVRWLHKWFR